MLHQIIYFSIKNKLLVGLAVLVLIIYGSYQATQLPIDAVPDITDNQVQVITSAPALGAPDIERLITFPIEQANSNIPGLKEIRSFSRFGLSLITIVFNDDVNVYWARQQVTERLKIAESQIPAGLGTPELAPVTTGLGEIYQYVIKPAKGFETSFDPTALRTIQDWIVRRQLLSVKGVADVSSFGGKLKQYEIALNPSLLKAHQLSINDVFKALESNNENTGGAYIEKSATVLYIRSEGLIKSIEDLQNIAVKTLQNGTTLLLRDIAELRIAHATRYGAICYNDEGEVAGAVVMMLKGENSSRVIKDVKERIEQIRQTLPEGVEIEPFLDRTKMVNSAISTVSKNLMEGALIVVFILVLFLGNFRAGILVASVIPLSMLFAVILMNLFGVSGNLMSLGALDFGLIVDGAVIIVEAVMHSLTHNKRFAGITRISSDEMDQTVHHSAHKMMNSAVFGQIIILIVYLPIFSLEGIEGKMFIPMAQTVAFALLGAFLLSISYIPMMSTLFLSKKISQERNFSDRMMDFLIHHQQIFLKRILSYPKFTLSLSFILFTISLLIFSRLGGEFIPELPEGDFAVDTRVLTGSNLSTSIQATTQSAKLLLEKFPEIEKIVSKTGSGEIPTDPMPMEASDMMIILKDKSQWTSAKSWDELAQKMSVTLEDIPGVTYSFQYPVAMRFNELMTGAKQDVVCKIFGENIDSLSKYSSILGQLVSQVYGAENIYVEPVEGLPQLMIEYNRKAIAQYGISISEINKIVNASFAGQSSGLVFEDEKRFDIVVRLSSEFRKNPEDVKNLLIPTPLGTQIPLYELAQVSIRESINQIQREDAKRRIIVGFNVAGRDIQNTVQDLQKLVDQQMKLPSGYHISYGGAFENLQAAKDRLTLAVPVSLLLILIFLYFAFGSIKKGLLIYSAIPLSIIGGVFSLLIRGMPFSISAGVGFIALFGVAVLNGIVLIAEFNRIRHEGITDLKQIVLHGTKHRLRPVLMTALVASLGFLPMALSQGAGAEVQRPLATVVIGGLIVATLLTIFVLPVLYVLFENLGKNKNFILSTKTHLLSIIILFYIAQSTSAQQKITLSAAIDTALRNNLQLKQNKLESSYQNALLKTGFNPEPTKISGQWGQFNSIYNDNAIAISQEFSFPTVYKKQISLQNEVIKASSIHIQIGERELKKQLSENYHHLLYLFDKRKIILEQDSLYSAFLDRTELKFKLGESNTIEKNTAVLQREKIKMDLQKVNHEIKVSELRFQLLLNSEMPLTPDPDWKPIPIFKVPDQNNPESIAPILKDHPLLQWWEQQQWISKAERKWEKTKMLPTMNLGLQSLTIQGTGADDVVYNSAKRFTNIQFGIGIPLFYTSGLAKIKAGKIREEIYQIQYDAALQSTITDYQSKLVKYKNLSDMVKHYDTVILPKSSEMLQASTDQLHKGLISMIEWNLLNHQNYQTKLEYTEILHELNQLIINLNFLTSK